MAVELSEHETENPLRDRKRLAGRLNNLLPFPAKFAEQMDMTPEDGSGGFDSDVDDTVDESPDLPTDNIGRHVVEVVAGVNATIAAFATLLDIEGVLPKEKVRAALSNAWLDLPEAEALGGAGDVFEDVIARLS